MATDRLASLGSAAFDLFERVITHAFNSPVQASSSPPGDLPVRLENRAAFAREYSRFRIWTVDLGLLVPGHGSLDYRLRDAEKLGATFEAFLNDLLQSLRETLEFSDSNLPIRGSFVAGGHQADIDLGDPAQYGSTDGSDSEEEEKEPQWYIDVLLESIADIIDRLFKLSTLIRNPATRLSSSKADSYRKIDPDSGADLIDAFSHFDHDYVLSAVCQYQSQFPSELREAKHMPNKPSPASTPLWHQDEDCGICKARSIDVGDTDSSDFEEDTETKTRWPEAEEAAQYIIQRIARANNHRRRRFAYWKHHQGSLERHTAKALTAITTPSIAMDVVPIESDENKGREITIPLLQPAGLLAPPTVTTATTLRLTPVFGTDDRSEVSVSEYAASEWGPGREVIPFPSPPNVPSRDKFFLCPYCYTVCPRRMASERAWKAHLIHDLRPYLCTYPECATANQQYDRQQDWVEHENTFHRRRWQCPDHTDAIYLSRDKYLHHITSDHSADSQVMSSESYLRSCESAPSIPDRPCPICFFAAPDVLAAQSHLARHLERFALFALPRSTNNDVEDEDDVNSAAAVDAVQSTRNLGSDLSALPEADLDNLTAAVRAGDLARVEDMLDGAFASEGDKDVALIEACQHGLGEIVRALLYHGANVNYKTEKSTPLMAACFSGHLNIVEDLISHGADVHAALDTPVPLGTALLAACAGGNVEIVKRLVFLGVNVNAALGHFFPLGVAAAFDQDQVVDLLIALGARFGQLIDGFEATALEEAVKNGNIRTTSTLIRRGAGPDMFGDVSELFHAVQRGDEDLVKLLIESGAKVNWYKTGHSTMLQAAIRTHKISIIQILLKAGVDLNKPAIESASGRTKDFALHRAVIDGNEDIVRLLLRAGAGPNALTSLDETPLHFAVSQSHPAIVKLLIEVGADPDALTSLDETPLHFAISQSHPAIVKLLIEAGADLNLSSPRHGTVLQLAALHSDQEIYDMLLAAGAQQDTGKHYMDHIYNVAEVKPPVEFPRKWDIQEILFADNPLNLAMLHDFAQTDVVACVAFSNDGESLAIASHGAVRIFSVDTMLQKAELEHSFGLFVRSVAFSPDGKFLLTGGDGCTTSLWEIATGQEIFTHRSNSEIYAVAFSPDGIWMAVGRADGQVHIFDVAETKLSRIVGCRQGVASLEFSADSCFLVAGVLNGEITTIDVQEEEIATIAPRPIYGDSVMGVALSGDGTMLYTASLDKNIECRRWPNGLHPPRVIDAHEDVVLSLAITRDSRHLVSGSRDKTIRLWNTETRDLEVVVRGHKGSLTSVATCPTKNLIATASCDKTVTVWKYD